MSRSLPFTTYDQSFTDYRPLITDHWPLTTDTALTLILGDFYYRSHDLTITRQHE
jgi:hypothetical protein